MHHHIPRHIQHVLTEVKTALQRLYAQRLTAIMLFGSYARGDFTADSDIDLLILLEAMTNWEIERERYFPLISELSLKYDVVISVIPWNAAHFPNPATPLSLNAQREGVRL